MARYIDADIVLAKLKDFSNDYYRINAIERAFGVDDAMFIIKDAPTADVEKVRHGEWIKNTKVYRDLGISESFDYFCSCCRSEAYSTRHEEEYAYVNKYWRYCPNCGAKMDGEIE